LTLKIWRSFKIPYHLIFPQLIPIIYFLSSIYVLRNQPWINRLLVPSFVLLCIYFFIYLGQSKSLNLKLVSIPTIVFFFYSSTFLLYSTDKPILKGKSFFFTD
jgi:hypothetical protein